MARQPNKKGAAHKRRKKSGDTNAGGILFVIFVGALAAVKFNVAMLLLFGLLPTLVLGITGKGAFKAERMQCVALANIAGVIMLIPEVWTNPNAFERVIFDFKNWIIMWGSAAIGYALIYIGPMIAAIVMQSLAQDRVKKINSQRQELVEMWGTDVLGDKDDDKVDFGRGPRRPL
jgi:hypothetical protein